MLLSKVLKDYYVLPLGQSEIAGFGIAEGREIHISWHDSDEGQDYRQDFLDQEINTGDVLYVRGQFLVTTIEGDVVAFIALDGVELK